MLKVLQKDFNVAEFKRPVYRVDADSDSNPHDFTHVECWAHVAKNTPVGSLIEVFPRSGAWFLEMIVRGKVEGGLRVAVLHFHDFKDDVELVLPTDSAADFEVKFRGRAKWSVLRKSDGQVVFEGGDTKEDAEAFVAKQDAALA